MHPAGDIFSKLPDRLEPPVSLSLALKAELSGGTTVWLAASVTTYHAAPSTQRVEGLRGPLVYNLSETPTNLSWQGELKMVDKYVES